MNSHPRGREEQYLKSIELSHHLWFISVDSENMSFIIHMDSFIVNLMKYENDNNNLFSKKQSARYKNLLLI